MYGTIGFIIGFLVGLLANAYLLRGTPKSVYINDKSKRRKYGLLNWGIALLGMIIGIAIGQTKH